MADLRAPDEYKAAALLKLGDDGAELKSDDEGAEMKLDDNNKDEAPDDKYNYLAPHNCSCSNVGSNSNSWSIY